MKAALPAAVLSPLSFSGSMRPEATRLPRRSTSAQALQRWRRG